MGERIKILTMGDINPPHKGHENVIKSCKEIEGGEVNIDFRISVKPLEYLLPWDVREKLLNELIKGCDTLKDCVNILPKDKNLFEIDLSKYDALLIGSDIANKIREDFFKGKEQEFFNSFKKLIVVNRPGYEINENDLDELKDKINKEVVIIEGKVEMSSSEIREKYRNGDEFDKHIPDSVLKYIKNNPNISEEFKIFFNEKNKIEQNDNSEKIIDEFYEKFVNNNDKRIQKITLEQLRELKEKGITTEKFLDYLCQKHNFLLHGSIYKIEDEKLRSNSKKIFASNKSAIAIMRSIYSNSGVNLEYPYFLSDDSPLILKIHTNANGEYISKEKGYIYVVQGNGFENNPDESWQFIKESEEVPFHLIIETEKNDFNYLVEFYNDLDKNI